MQSGTIREVYENPRDEYTARLLGPVNVLGAKELKNFFEIETKGMSFLRPEALKVVPKGGVEAVVENCHFAGSGYSLSVSIGGKRMEVWGTKAYSAGTKVHLRIKK